MPQFDGDFALNSMLPFAEAAYDVAAGKTPLLPTGYTVKSIIKADPQRVAAVMAQISLPHQRMVRAMVATNSIMGFVGRNDATRAMVVSFRGTETPEEWLKDFEALALPFGDIANSGLVHQGFAAVYLTIRDSVIAGVDTAKVGAASMWVTGHSLGAAVAALSALDFAKNAVPPLAPQLYTFAGPRVGNDDFKTLFDATIPVCYRVWNRWDIVPQLPAPPLFIHVGQGVEVDGGFTLDLAKAHSLTDSYKPGLLKLPAKGPVAVAATG
ncbi:MAG TPA: lipase family protein [Bryobacteraceae bacterium]|jgi:triacylglycerol lipase|nr:lipase family protein [Bryobacteraceae bacterium]